MNPIVKRLLVIAAAALLLVYIGFQGYKIVVSPLGTETVGRVTAYRTLNTDGIVFREETVITNRPSGYLFYSVQNGSRVSRGGKIADVFASESDALAQQELDKLDAEIASLSSINAQGTSNRANLTAINRQIDELWLTITTEAQSTAIGDMESYHSRLLTLLNKRQITIGRVENFDARLEEMRAERKSLAASFKAASGTVSSPVAGYFIGELDGYEGRFGTNGVTDLSAAQVRDALAYKPTGSVNGIGKIVGDYEWYLACELTLEQAAELKMGARMEVCMPFVSSQVIPMEIVAINKDQSGTAALVLKCTNMDKALSTVRVEKVEIRLKQYSGIRIPDRAIHFNDKQEPGVYVQAGNVLAFRRVRVLHHDASGEYSVCEITDESGYAKLYDKIVVKGEDLYDGKLVR